MARKYKTTYRKDFIVERPDGFQYKRHIPEGLRPLFGGRTAWTKFLGRVTRKEAEAAAREQAIEHDRLIAGAGALTPTEAAIVASARVTVHGPLSDLTLADLRNRNVPLDITALAREPATELAGHEAWDRMRKIETPAYVDAWGSVELPRDDVSDAVKVDAYEAVQELRDHAAQSRADVMANRRILRKLSGDVGAGSLLALVEMWKKETNPRAGKSTDKMTKFAERFIELVGDLPPCSINRKHAASYRDALEAPALKLSPVTVDKHLYGLRRMFAVALSINAVPSNPFVGVKARKDARVKLSDTGKKKFTVEQANLIFDRLAELPADDQVVMRLLAYQGMRGGEACQLRACDIVRERGIDTLTVTDAAGSVKNRPSLRTIPLHPAIARELVELAKGKAPDDYLFSSYPAWAHTRAGKFQQRANAWLRSIGITDKQVTIHSWRHTWRTLARELEMPESISRAIMGHTLGSGDHGAYGSAPSLKRQAEWLGKVDPLAG